MKCPTDGMGTCRSEKGIWTCTKCLGVGMVSDDNNDDSIHTTQVCHVLVGRNDAGDYIVVNVDNEGHVIMSREQEDRIVERITEMVLRATKEGEDEALSGTLPIGEVASTINDDTEEKS